jgi:hypothetical protein
MALGSTQPLTEMSTRNLSWGVMAAGCVKLTTLPPSYTDWLNIWEPQPPGTLRAYQGLSWDCFTGRRRDNIRVLRFLVTSHSHVKTAKFTRLHFPALCGFLCGRIQILWLTCGSCICLVNVLIYSPRCADIQIKSNKEFQSSKTIYWFIIGSYITSVFRLVCKIEESDYLLHHICLSLSARPSFRPHGTTRPHWRDFMKWHFLRFFEDLLRTFKFN